MKAGSGPRLADCLKLVAPLSAADLATYWQLWGGRSVRNPAAGGAALCLGYQVMNLDAGSPAQMVGDNAAMAVRRIACEAEQADLAALAAGCSSVAKSCCASPGRQPHDFVHRRPASLAAPSPDQGMVGDQLRSRVVTE